MRFTPVLRLNSDLHCLPIDWPAPARVRAAFTSRKGGRSRDAWASLNLASHVGDEPAAVAANRATLAAHLGLAGEPCWLEQIHSDIVLNLDDPAAGRCGDAAITGTPHRVAAVMVADCLPVLLCDGQGQQVAAVHAGWRGLAANLIAKTICGFNAPPDRLIAWLGPAIGPTAYQIGDDLYTRFMTIDPRYSAAFVRIGHHWHMDLAQLALLQLHVAGVHRVSRSGVCVHDDAQNFFSYRRDGETGRMAALIWINTNA